MPEETATQVQMDDFRRRLDQQDIVLAGIAKDVKSVVTFVTLSKGGMFVLGVLATIGAAFFSAAAWIWDHMPHGVFK